MKKYVDDIGNTAEFDDNISEEIIKEHLEMLGKNWKKQE